MQFVVQAAGVAHRLALVVPAPQGGRVGHAIRATETGALRGRRFLLRPDRRSIYAVHFRVQTTGVTEIVSWRNGNGR